MRRRLLVGALLPLIPCASFWAPRALAQPASCVVRLHETASQLRARRDRVDALQSILNAAQPVHVRPLLAGGHVAASTDAAALVSHARLASDTAAPHPFASWYVLAFESPSQRERAVQGLRSHPAVAAVEPVRTLHIPTSQPGASRSSGPTRVVPWNVQRVRAPEALAAIQPDSTVMVAVIDSGADLLHPDLQPTLWQNADGPGNSSPLDDTFDQNGDGFIEEWERHDDDDNGYVDDLWGYDFTDAPGQGGVGDALGRDALPQDEDGHGTHVAGIVAADGQLQGIAPFVRLMVVRAAYSRVFGGAALETDDAAAAIVYAVDNGARILNLSFGDEQESRLIRDAIDYALARNVIVVAAAGNGSSADAHYPSSHPGVIGVGASDRNDRRASFSNFGAGVELVAPGEDSGSAGILSLDLDGGTRERRGTSMAAPHVAGVAAIVLSRADRPSAGRARALMVAAARRSGSADWSTQLGHGIADALAAATTDDDVVVQVLAPAQPYFLGRFQLFGTVLAGDAPVWSVAARRLGDNWLELVAPQARQVVADTLVSAPLIGVAEGDWEYLLAVELGDGRLREARGAFRVENSAPKIQRHDVSAVWRGARPRWLLTAQTDAPCRLSVQVPSGGKTLFSTAGFDRFSLLEVDAVGDVTPGWTLVLKNASGHYTPRVVPSPSILPPWPEHARMHLLEPFVPFEPEPVVGRAPNGQPVVWGRPTDAPRHMQAWTLSTEQLHLVHDTGIEARPLASADINGDGAPDLLIQQFVAPPGGARFAWLVTRGSFAFPDSLAADATAARALGLFNLDDDAAHETLLSTQDQLFLYDDAVGKAPRLMQTLQNPSQTSFNVFGSGAAVADIDRDGRREIVCGDADGAIAIFERGPSGEYAVERVLDSGGSYAYEFAALPEGGFLVGRQRTQDVAGDGFQTVAYDFVHYDTAAVAQRKRSFAAQLNALDAGVTSFRSTASGDEYVVLASEGNVYLARGAAEPRELVSMLPGGGLPAIADLDADGQLELVVSTPDGAEVYRFFEDVRGPHSLRTETLGPTRLQLRWQSGAGVTSRVQRSTGLGFQDLGDTSASTWVDSTLQAFVPASYRVQAVVNGEVRGTTNTVTAQAQPRPRLLRLEIKSPRNLRLRFSNPLHGATLRPERVRVRDAQLVRPVLALTLSEAGRVLDVTLGKDVACGNVEVEVDSLRDEQWGLLEPPHVTLQAPHTCAGTAFHVVGVTARLVGAQAFRVEFSRAPASEALDVATYGVRWNGADVELATVQAVDAQRFDLLLSPGTRLLGHGIPYEVRVAPTLRAAIDAAELVDAGTVHRVYVQGDGAQGVFAYPNPVRNSDTEVVFAEAAPDTRVRIYNLEGALVRELSGARGGGLRWDLRNHDGRTVSSGVYVYVARDAQGTKRGRVAILR